MKKTYLINDLFWITFGFAICLGGLNLGFGSFHAPEAGFMPFLAGLLLAILAIADLAVGFHQKWESDRPDKVIWANIHWRKLLITLGLLILYNLLFSTLGFIIATFVLLLFLYQVMKRKSWGTVLIAAALTTLICYVAFKIGLDSQLPQGLLGF